MSKMSVVLTFTELLTCEKLLTFENMVLMVESSTLPYKMPVVLTFEKLYQPFGLNVSPDFYHIIDMVHLAEFYQFYYIKCL